MCDQWRVGALGGVFGLHWPSVAILLDGAGIKLRRGLLRKLRGMERAAVDVLNKSRRGR